MHCRQDRGFRCFHIDHGAILDPARKLLADPQNLEAVRPLTASLLDARDQATDLAAAHVERREDSVPVTLQALIHPQLYPCPLQVSVPLRLGGVGRRPVTLRRTRRSGRRMSIIATSRSRTPCCRSSSASWLQASSAPNSGRRTSTPPSRRRFQRRSDTHTAATTRLAISGSRSSSATRFRAWAGAPSPTTSGRLMKRPGRVFVIGCPC